MLAAKLFFSLLSQEVARRFLLKLPLGSLALALALTALLGRFWIDVVLLEGGQHALVVDLLERVEAEGLGGPEVDPARPAHDLDVVCGVERGGIVVEGHDGKAALPEVVGSAGSDVSAEDGARLPEPGGPSALPECGEV